MNFTVYDKSTGKITKTIVCEDIIQQINPDIEGYIEGYYSDALYYVREGVPVSFPKKPVGEYWELDFDTKTWTQNISKMSSSIIAARNIKLQLSDWTQLPDVPLNTKESWAAYRQQLRDITAQPDYPYTVIWPTPPQ